MTSLYLNCDGEGILDTSRSEINYRYWLSDEATRIMIYIHGMGSHSGRAHYLADFFKKNNTSIYAMDQQGHGKRKGKKGHVKRINECINEILAFINYVKEKHPNLPLYLVGHSWGGLNVLLTAYEKPDIQGLIVSSPLVEINMKKTFIQKISEPFTPIASVIFPIFSLETGIKPEMVTTDEEIRKNHAEDPLWTSKATARLYSEVLKAKDYLKKEQTLFPKDLPVLIMQAGEDKLVSASATEEFFNKLKSEDKTFKLYEEAYHEVFSDPKRESIYSEVLEWIVAREK